MSESGKGGDSAGETEKQMIKDLRELEMYEPSMSVHEMKQLLKAVKDSQVMANSGGQNKNANKTPEQTRQDNQPCYSRSLNAKGSDRNSMSPDLRKNVSQEKHGDSSDETIYSAHSRNSFVKENKDIQPANINKMRSSINENSSEGIDNKRVQRANFLGRAPEPAKCRVNPLESLINPSDVPLQPHYRTLPEKDCADAGTSVNIDKAVAQLSNHLQQIAELWHGQHGSSAKNHVPWGKAIQVGTDNGSLNKELVPDTTSEDAGTSETNINLDSDRRRRACARKIIDYTAGEVDDNSDDDFEQTSSSKRRKSTKRTVSSEKTSLSKGNFTSETTRRRRNVVPKKDDIYEWQESIEDDNSDEELQSDTKKIKLTKGFGTSEKTSSPIENETTRSNNSILERNDLYKWEQLIEESDVDLEKSPEKTLITKDAELSENTNSMEETATAATTKIRGNVGNRGDIYEWETVNEGNNNYEESQKGAKKKKPKRVTATQTSKQKSVEPVSSNAAEKREDSPMRIDDSDEIIISDTEERNETLQKPQRGRSEEAVSSTSSSYPRRIIPPNPKRKCSGINARKPNFSYSNLMRERRQTVQNREDDEEVARTNNKGRANRGLLESEITEVLDNIDVEKVTSPVDLEIRPLRITGRMKRQVERLQSLNKEEELLKIQRAEEERIKEEMLRREKEEKIKQRLKKEKENARREELEAKAKVNMETRWNNLLKQTEKKRQFERTELNPEGPRQNSDLPIVEVGRENNFQMEQNDVELMNNDGEKRSKHVPCPICGKKFPSAQIEDHAASCEEYDSTNSATASRSNSPAVSLRSATSVRRKASAKFECIVCSAFASNDGKKYEEHVNKCVARHRDGVAAGPSTVVEVPDSPIRNLQKVSEIADSDINYKGQFVPKSKSHVNANRKRKRF